MKITRWPCVFWTVCLSLELSLIGGCVRRTLTINTTPDGAHVTLNDEQIGTTPVNVDFTWYGDYDVVIRKEGYQTLHTHQIVQRPWYQLPGIDLFAETAIPFTVHDKHQMHFELEPAQPISREELVEDARALRERALFTEE